MPAFSQCPGTRIGIQSAPALCANTPIPAAKNSISCFMVYPRMLRFQALENKPEGYMKPSGLCLLTGTGAGSRTLDLWIHNPTL